MARVSQLTVISMLVGVVILSAVGFWWIYKPLPQVEPPQLFVSDDFSIADDSQVWNREVLGRFEELSMQSASFTDRESYRLVLMPTFDPPIAVRASRTTRGFELTTKLLDGKGGYEIGKLLSNETRPLTEAEWQHLIELLDGTSFWSMPTIDPNDGMPNDGASYLIESRRDGMFHDVARRTPTQKFIEACSYFLKLAGREADYEGYL